MDSKSARSSPARRPAFSRSVRVERRLSRRANRLFVQAVGVGDHTTRIADEIVACTTTSAPRCPRSSAPVRRLSEGRAFSGQRGPVTPFLAVSRHECAPDADPNPAPIPEPVPGSTTVSRAAAQSPALENATTARLQAPPSGHCVPEAIGTASRVSGWFHQYRRPSSCSVAAARRGCGRRSARARPIPCAAEESRLAIAAAATTAAGSRRLPRSTRRGSVAMSSHGILTSDLVTYDAEREAA